MLDDFHFLRPAWLIALPIGALLIYYAFKAETSGGAWRRVVDRALQPLVLSGADRHSGHRGRLLAVLAAWVLGTIALAGPTWERLPVPAFRSNEAVAVALDLSRSMDAADLAPSRITRAKLKLLSLLDRRDGGQTGLVVFSSHAFTVTPLTTDTRTISSLVAALTTDIMPSSGSRLAVGLEKAASLLRQGNVSDGRIVLMTDATPTREDLDLAAALAREGIEINVLAIGTEDGAPIPERDGGFLTDARGNVVIPRLEVRGLAALAAAGGGRFSMLTADDADLERLEPPASSGGLLESEDTGQMADVWRDAGPLASVLLLPFLALGFRRGWIAAVAACVLLPMPEARAQVLQESGAVEAEARGGVGDWWSSLWSRRDQQGLAALSAEQPEQAARLFEDPEWRAAAQYRAGDYSSSAGSLAGFDTAQAHYNRGTALARAGDIDGAIAAYDRALELEPEHEDARYNRDLLEQYREQNPPPEPSSSDDQQQGEQTPQQSDSGEAPQQDDAGDAGGEPQQAQDGSETQPSDGEPGDDGEQGDAGEQLANADPDTPADRGEGEADAEPDAAQAEADEAEDNASAAEDLERWASDQAAEQWLRRIQQDPGGLLRRKFLYQYQRLGIDQDGNYTRSRDEAEPW